MKVKTQLALPLVLLALATGCASNHEKIVFADEAEIRAQSAAAPAPAIQKHLERADESQIEQHVFGYLLEHPLWNLAGCSAIFLQADDTEVAAMMKKYPDHVPPIKPSNRARLKSHRPPLDRDTKKVAIVLTVELSAPDADDSVNATGRWYAGDAVTGFRAFHLKKVDGSWQIEGAK